MFFVCFLFFLVFACGHPILQLDCELIDSRGCVFNVLTWYNALHIAYVKYC